jgi:transcriptional regulator with XRE-family HTH domain
MKDVVQHQKCCITLIMSFSAVQCRAARALIGWSQDELEAASQVAKKTIADFERQARQPHVRTLAALRAALEAAGVEFIPEHGGGAGVRLRKSR